VAIPFVNDDPATWDAVVIGVDSTQFVFAQTMVDVPGSIALKWDVKNAPGSDGAYENYRGIEPKAFVLTWIVYTADHWTTFQLLLAAILPKLGKLPPPVIQVSHPLVALYKMLKFNLVDIPFLKPKGKQQYEAGLNIMQWYAAPKPTGKKPDPNDTTLITGVSRVKSLDPTIPVPPPLPSKNIQP
jgi:hypothetical protein